MKTCKRKKKYPADHKYRATDPTGSVLTYTLKPIFSKFGWYPPIGGDSLKVKIGRYDCIFREYYDVEKHESVKGWENSLRKIEDDELTINENDVYSVNGEDQWCEELYDVVDQLESDTSTIYRGQKNKNWKKSLRIIVEE